MSTIDPSTILTTQPPSTAPTTAGVRGVFAAVKAQITAAKADVEALEADVVAAEADIDALEASVTSLASHASRHMPSGADPLTTAAAGTIQPDDTASEGTAESLARSDHRHAIAAGTPAALAVRPDSSRAEGTATSFARSDHIHDATCDTAVAATCGGAAAEGVATTFARSDHEHSFATGAPSDCESVLSGAEGISAAFARATHRHQINLTAAPTGSYAAGDAGRFMYDTTLGQITRDDGAAWVAVAPPADQKGFAAGDKIEESQPLAGYATTLQPVATLETVGGGAYDPSVHSVAGLTRTIRFEAILSSSDGILAATAVLYSISDAQVISTLASTSATPTKVSQVLTVGAVGANQIPDAEKVYEVRLYEALGTGVELATLHSAAIVAAHVAP